MKEVCYISQNPPLSQAKVAQELFLKYLAHWYVVAIYDHAICMNGSYMVGINYKTPVHTNKVCTVEQLVVILDGTPHEQFLIYGVDDDIHAVTLKVCDILYLYLHIIVGLPHKHTVLY